MSRPNIPFRRLALEAIRRALGEVDPTPAVQVSSAAISRGVPAALPAARPDPAPTS